MEPHYRGMNGRIDALAAAWLFAHDHLFFADGDVTWDGSHHSINALQSNVGLETEAPIFWSNRQALSQGAADLVLWLEKDEELIVPRDQISPGLYSAIGEGDLTGLTLFNLQACGRAFSFLNGSNVTAYGSFVGMESSSEDESNWESVQDALQMAGMDELLANPAAKSSARVVVFDTRLANGIPNFFSLVTKMYEDMLDYNEIDLPYILIFMSTFNFDADPFLGDVGDPVPGAASAPIHIETNALEWHTSRDSEEDAGCAVEAATAEDGTKDEDADEEASERKAMIAMLRLLVLAAELSGKSLFPKELLDELERAENGDESVDLNDLAERLNACIPDTQAADLSNVTFDDGNVVEGRRFKMSYPDGWTAIKDYEESMLFMTQTRPFVIVQGEATAEDDLSNFDRIVYSSLGRDAEIGEVDEMCGFDDKHWALCWYNCYDRSDSEGIASMKPIVVWDTEIDAVNTKCLVTQQQTKADGANGLEFDVYPYAADHMDSLRFMFTYEEGMDIEPVRNLVLKMAESIELDDPYVPNCMKTLEKAVSSKVSVEEFVEMVDHVSKPYIALRQMIFTASQYKYASAADDFDDDECTLAGAQGIADLCNRSVSKFEKMMDAYDAQVAAGYTIGELDRLLDALESFNREVYPTTEIFDYDDARLIKKKGIFDETDELRSVRERLKYAKQHGGMASKPSGAKASAAAAVSFTPSTQAKAREKRTISEPFKTDALPRIEKALNEKVSSSYFIETSEIAANALMSARQEACDEEISPWNSDEDNVTGMARAFARFNSIICRYYGHFVNALEAQVELGTTPGEIKRMAAEVNEFGELVADRFSCGNPYLDEVANSRAPVTRPVEYASIRARWQKIIPKDVKKPRSWRRANPPQEDDEARAARENAERHAEMSRMAEEKRRAEIKETRKKTEALVSHYLELKEKSRSFDITMLESSVADELSTINELISDAEIKNASIGLFKFAEKKAARENLKKLRQKQVELQAAADKEIAAIKTDYSNKAKETFDLLVEHDPKNDYVTAEYSKRAIIESSVGDVVQFGKIKWIVLKKNRNDALLYAKDILAQAYFSKESDKYSESHLREVMHSLYMKELTDADRELVIAGSGDGLSEKGEDKFYALSRAEIQTYLPESQKRVAMFEGEKDGYWLRDSVNSAWDEDMNVLAAGVDRDGAIERESIDGKKRKMEPACFYVHIEAGVRPACWIRVD